MKMSTPPPGGSMKTVCLIEATKESLGHSWKSGDPGGCLAEPLPGQSFPRQQPAPTGWWPDVVTCSAVADAPEKAKGAAQAWLVSRRRSPETNGHLCPSGPTPFDCDDVSASEANGRIRPSGLRRRDVGGSTAKASRQRGSPRPAGTALRETSLPKDYDFLCTS